MTRMRRFFVYSAGLPILAIILAYMAMPGCSGDNTVVAEGDPTVRRKSKEEALRK